VNKDRWKWAFTYVLLAMLFGWAAFCVNRVQIALETKSTVDILAAAGVSGLLGAGITWMSSVVHFWFRKKSPEEGK